MRLHLVVARYKEDVSWIDKVDPNWIPYVYEKSANLTLARGISEPLPNVGREAHTYLHHILAHWDKLPDFAAFVQGDPVFHMPDVVQTINYYGLSPFEPFYPLGHYCECDYNGAPQHGGLPIGSTWANLTGQHRDRFKFVVGAQFIVSRERIQARSRDFYERCLALVDKDRGATVGGHNDGLSWGAHVMERYWEHIFSE